MREVNQGVAGQTQLLALKKLEDRQLAFVQPVSIGLKFCQSFAADERFRTFGASQQHAALLESFTDRGNLNRLHVGGIHGAVQVGVQGRIEVSLIRFSARENQRA